MTLFGTRMDADIKRAANDAKTQKEADRKVAQVIAKWLNEKPQFKNPVIGAVRR
ncbi:MAG: hypothetical protein WBC29_01830 [Candidatus Moraniibacteriota bacterium]